MPALSLAGSVLEGKGVDTVALLNGVLALLVAGAESLADGVEGRRGRELVYMCSLVPMRNATDNLTMWVCASGTRG